MTALFERSGLVPTGVLGPAVSAALAGILSTSPRLHLEVAILARAVWAAVTTMLAWIGGAVVAMVFLWDELDPASAWTLGDAVKHLRADAPTIFFSLLMVWAMFCALRFGIVGSTRSGAIRHAALAREGVTRSDRELTARHEAAHALVACVLGMPLESACERGPRPVQESMWGLQTQRDWAQAKELSWFAASLRPGQVLVDEVLEAVIPALHAEPWTTAIEKGADVLLRAGSDRVLPEVFAAIAHHFGLALPVVEAVCRMGAGHSYR